MEWIALVQPPATLWSQDKAALCSCLCYKSREMEWSATWNICCLDCSPVYKVPDLDGLWRTGTVQLVECSRITSAALCPEWNVTEWRQSPCGPKKRGPKQRSPWAFQDHTWAVIPNVPLSWDTSQDRSLQDQRSFTDKHQWERRVSSSPRGKSLGVQLSLEPPHYPTVNVTSPMLFLNL